MQKDVKTKKKWSGMPFLIILVVFLFSLILIHPRELYTTWQQSKAHNSVVLTVTPTPTPLPTNYPNLPREFFENADQTTGIIYGGLILVSIIFIGVGVFLWRERKCRDEK